MFFRSFALVAVLAFLAAAVGSEREVLAKDDAAAAKVHYAKGTRLYEVGDYRQALEEFKAAHLAKPDPAFLYNIAQCHRQLGEIEQAVTLYKRFLASSPDAANRAEVERRVAEMEADLAAKKQGAATTTTSAAIVAQPAASAPAPAAAAPSASSSATSASLASAPGLPGTTVQPVAVATLARPQHAGSSLRYLRWIGAGVTIALAGGAVVSGLSASSKFNDLKITCGTTNAGCSDGDVNQVKSRALLTNILWGAAGATAVATGVVFYLTPHESGVQVAWRF